MSAIYEIRVRGRVTDWLLAELTDLDATVVAGDTLLHGPLVDQAALHGLLDRIQALGLELVEVRRVPE